MKDSLWEMRGREIASYVGEEGRVYPSKGNVFRLSQSDGGQWILMVDKDGMESSRVRTDTVTDIVWSRSEEWPKPKPKVEERFTEQQRAFWESLGGKFGVDGTPADITGATFEQACRWWLAGGEAKHEEHVEWMRRDGIGVVFNRERKGIVCWDCVIEDCLSNRWILKAAVSVLAKYHG